MLDCIITDNVAFRIGGGVYSGFLNRCVIAQNTVRFRPAISPGAVQGAVLNNCLITENQYGGISFSRATNCAILRNTSLATSVQAVVVSSILHQCTVALNTEGGVTGGSAVNSIIWNNWNSLARDDRIIRNYLGPLPVMSFCCTYPLPSGTGNIAEDPQLLDDGIHLAATSPCRGAGLASAASGFDLDGDPWSNPPSMGCDEVVEAAFVGPLTVTLTIPHPQVAAAIPQLLTGEINGRAARIEWSFGDGVIAANLSYQTGYAWTTPGTYTVTLTAYNEDHPSGVSAQATVEVQPWLPPQLGAGAWRNGQYTLSFTSQFGLTCVVEQTTDLTPPITWQLQQTVPGTGGLIRFTNTEANAPMEFYRVRTE